jgi:hypothetical protein
MILNDLYLFIGAAISLAQLDYFSYHKSKLLFFEKMLPRACRLVLCDTLCPIDDGRTI